MVLHFGHQEGARRLLSTQPRLKPPHLSVFSEKRVHGRSSTAKKGRAATSRWTSGRRKNLILSQMAPDRQAVLAAPLSTLYGCGREDRTCGVPGRQSCSGRCSCCIMHCCPRHGHQHCKLFRLAIHALQPHNLRRRQLVAVNGSAIPCSATGSQAVTC